MNVPAYREKRFAAVAEKRASLARKRAELASLIDRINLEVQRAYEQTRESAETIKLYRETLLPAADENVKTAQFAYVTGKIPFLSLIEAERELVDIKDRHYQAIAQHQRRLAELRRACGIDPRLDSVESAPASDASTDQLPAAEKGSESGRFPAPLE